MGTQPYTAPEECFPGMGRIPFEGRGSDDPPVFKVCDAGERIGGKTTH